ncbi:apolipophorins-like isoform X2 [Triplophysa rosa]|uniref:apolipophorins-like isoform X2 n=1 Tax=Triplophysa rosa TaxID=992332 RepID=UPI002545DF1D|nr:apolipophorins-like isoform X2 [Triplophysa rosa]
MSSVYLLLIRNLTLIVVFGFLTAHAHKLQGQLCKSTCPDVQKGQMHTYRYSTTIANALKGPSLAGNQLALDCVVDIDVRQGCPEMILKMRNIQIKHSSSKRDNSVLRLKNIRESLEKNPLQFSLEGGKVTKLCPQEAEQVWTLNIKRSILSMLQTSDSGRARETVKETDVYGTCTSSYEQRGTSLIKTRNLQQCLSDRIGQFWRHSVPLKEGGKTVKASLTCIQLYDGTMMNKVNCTEIVSLVPLPGPLEVTETKTISSLTLLRTLEVIPMSLVQNTGYLSGLVFESGVQNPGRHVGSSVQEVTNSVRRLCAHLSDQQQSELLLGLMVQLRTLSSQQLRELWNEASFKCRDDWQPLLETLSACGSEACILFTTDLILNKEVDQEQTLALLNTITFAPYPTSSMINHTSALLQFPIIGPKALLVVSSLVHRLCQRNQTPCNEITEVQQFVHVLKQRLEGGCVVDDQSEITELLHVLKAVENAGMADLIPSLSRCVQDHTVLLELRLAAIRAFRRIPCHMNRKVLAWAFQRQDENVEVRIAAYQQLMHCPNQDIFRIVKTTLSIDKSSQVGSFIWSHLFNIQKTEDPLKKDLMESLPDDIISKDFEAEPWKYSSHMDYTVDTGVAAANMEGAVVFSPESFLPRYAMANLTVHILGRAFNLLEISFRMENLELILKNMFEEHPLASADNSRPKDSMAYEQMEMNSDEERVDISRKGCQSSVLDSIRSKFTGQRKRDKAFRCWINVKMFGSDVSFLTCDDLHAFQRKLSLNTAGLVVKLLKGQEIKISQRPIVMAEELVLPSLSGLPMKLSLNMSTVFTMRLKGTANYKNWSHFSTAGYVKPNAFVAISVRAGVDGAFGRVGSEWVTQFKTSTSLDGGVYVHHGQSVKVALNTPEDVIDIFTFSSRMFHVSGDTREELTAMRNLKEKNTCTPKALSKMIGWQLCSDLTYPLTPRGFPLLGPVLFSLRLQKLDKSLKQYLMEAAYTFVPQRNSWMPQEATLLLFLGTPQSTFPRDVSLDLNFNPKKMILKITHPLKTILIQGQLEQLNNQHSGRIELLIDNIHHYFIKGLMETVNSASETRAHFHLDAKVVADGHPITLSVNTTHARSRKITVQALLKNVFNKDASLSVQLERGLEDGQRHYSVDAGFHLPSVVSIRALGLLKQKGTEWSSALRLKCGVQEDPQHMQECHMTQNLHSESDAVQTYRITAAHELYCSHFFNLNHKIQLRHERSPIHVHSSLDISYGKQWNQSSNKHRILLNQSLRNQSGPALTSYAVELSLRLLDRGLNFRTQLLHSHFKRPKSESSTHLKINYNNQMPLVAGLHWKNLSAKASLQNWEGSFNMDTPWLYVYATQKLTQPQRGISHFNSEINTRKLVNIPTVTLVGFYKDRGKERQGQLHLFTPTLSYIKLGGWCLLGKRGVKGSYSIGTAWTPILHGEISLGNAKHDKTLEISGGCGKQDFNISAVLSTLDKKLKKRVLMTTMTLSDLKTPYVEFHMEGATEEMRKDRRIYQKRWRLHFRQPFKFIPQSLMLQETFTIALFQKMYTLESKVLVNGNKKAIHVLTLGYQPQHPYVCSSLVQSFSTDRIPQDSKICVTVQNNQTVRDIMWQLWTGKEEVLSVLGQVHLDITSASQQCITIKVNL